VIADGKGNPEKFDQTSDEQEILYIFEDRLVFKKNPNTHFSSFLQPKCKLGGFLSDEPKELIRSRFLGTQKTS